MNPWKFLNILLIIALCDGITLICVQGQPQYERAESSSIETEGLQGKEGPVQADVQGRTLGLLGNALLGSVVEKPANILGGVIGNLLGYKSPHGAGYGYGYPSYSTGFGHGFGYPKYSSALPYPFRRPFPGLAYPNYGLGSYSAGFGGYYG